MTTTGRVDYSPDYKSEKPPAVDYLSITTGITVRCPECGNADCEHANALAARVAGRYREQAALERVVIEAAKQWHEMRLMQAGTALSRKALMEAVTALVEFEANHP